MARKQHNKLVRDRIPAIIDAEKRAYETVIMGEKEYRQALMDKLVEEAREAATADTDSLPTELGEA